jgi:hypothetical protein
VTRGSTPRRGLRRGRSGCGGSGARGNRHCDAGARARQKAPKANRPRTEGCEGGEDLCSDDPFTAAAADTCSPHRLHGICSDHGPRHADARVERDGYGAASSRALQEAPHAHRVHVRKTPSLAIGGSAHRPPSTRGTGSTSFCCESFASAIRAGLASAVLKVNAIAMPRTRAVVITGHVAANALSDERFWGFDAPVEHAGIADGTWRHCVGWGWTPESTLIPGRMTLCCSR